MFVPMPSLSEGHKKLELFVGNWAGEEKLNPSPWDPEGGTAVGHVQNRLGLNGYAVIQEYEQVRRGKSNLHGHGVIVWNDKENNYEFHWYDSSGMPPSVFRGQCENGIFRLTAKSPMMQSRAIFDFSTPESYIFELNVSQDGENWTNFMEGAYKKQGA